MRAASEASEPAAEATVLGGSLGLHYIGLLTISLVLWKTQEYDSFSYPCNLRVNQDMMKLLQCDIDVVQRRPVSHIFFQHLNR